VLVLCLNLGNIHLPLSDKKQAGMEIVGFSVDILLWFALEIVTTFVTEPPSVVDSVLPETALSRTSPHSMSTRSGWRSRLTE
jgi:hypothetical protein